MIKWAVFFRKKRVDAREFDTYEEARVYAYSFCRSIGINPHSLRRTPHKNLKLNQVGIEIKRVFSKEKMDK